MELPFGVFLAPAALIAYLAGNQLIDWYLRISGLA
jgi:prepilin signal peptidase PulO-like enzyme (type II secretory pathway)